METISVRYGETFDVSVESADATAETATLYVGKAGETPVITVEAPFTDGMAFLNGTSDQTKVPLGEYKYMLTVVFSDGRKLKYPNSSDCDDCDDVELPDFIVREALDETEVV